MQGNGGGGTEGWKPFSSNCHAYVLQIIEIPQENNWRIGLYSKISQLESAERVMA